MSTKLDTPILPRVQGEVTQKQFNELAAALERWTKNVNARLEEISAFVSLP